MSTQEHVFETEVQDLLNLMIHSLYSNKDIFLRELISNASDALDKLRFETLTHPDWAPAGDFEVRLQVDKGQRTLSIIDNGIGMTRQELIENIGTIARSGTKAFLEAAKNQEGASSVPEHLIGQFGVGFYSSFIVADKVEVLTRKAGTEESTRWVSEGKGRYTLEEARRSAAGTTVTLHLKAVDEEHGLHDYTDAYTLRRIVKRHSDFVAYPIRMTVERQEAVLDDEGKPVVGAVPKLIKEDETFNSQQAIWTRPDSEVSQEEYTEFYRHVSGDWGEPLEVLKADMEGMFEAKLLLFIPKQAPFDLYQASATHKGMHLYVKRVFIMDECKELVPDWLRFIKGVVDSEDLSLNVSREILQQDRQVKAIRKFLVKRVLDALGAMKKDRPEEYAIFWEQFGPVLKEGLADTTHNHREKLLELIQVSSTESEELTSLADYVDRMKDEQSTIYYLTGPSLDAMRSSPHLEGFTKQGYEVLLLQDHVDEFWLTHGLKYKDHDFTAVSKGDFKLDEESKDDDEAADQADALKPLFDAFRRTLQDEVKEIRISKRLTDSPACLVGESHDMSPQLQALMKRLGQEVPKTKRVFELNPEHRLIQVLRGRAEADQKNPVLERYARVLYGQSILAEGGQLENPAAFAKELTDLMAEDLSQAVSN